ncbi:MAG: YqaJ viral recombinase family protein [Thermoplasmatales archaeon]|nr:YqaJ viral recombinase family protein [Thermoplasmatales archaeon]
MAIRFRPELIERIDYNERRIYFRKDAWIRRITGSRLATVLGENRFETPFSAALGMAGIYSKYEPNKYTEAGEALEPVIRNHARANHAGLFSEGLGLSEGDEVFIEEPEPKELCGYEHFPKGGIFGGMVDGYVHVNGRKAAVLEIKTAGDRARWEDADGNPSVPDNYLMQASLYAELAGLDKIVFVVGILGERHYDDPKSWVPSAENCFAIVVPKADISGHMARAGEWRESTLGRGFTPQWTDDDLEIVRYIESNLS